VRRGKVQTKNNWVETPFYDITAQPRPVIDRLRPGRGCRHVLRRCDVQRFVEILPDWAELSKGLNAILLAPYRGTILGWHRPGRVAICAWQRDLVLVVGDGLVEEDHLLLERLGVVPEPIGEGRWATLRFTEWSARGYQLLGVLLHELGHHHDRMTTRSRRNAARGEGYAVEYATRYAQEIWERYLEVFGE
jgi:hypothetical protein